MEIIRHLDKGCKYLLREIDEGYVLTFFDGEFEDTVVWRVDRGQVESLITNLGLVINRSVTLEEI